METSPSGRNIQWFLNIMWFFVVLALIGLGSFLIHKNFQFLHTWAVGLFISWFIITVIITRIKPEEDEGAKRFFDYIFRTLLCIINGPLLVISVLIELKYFGKSLWFGSIPALIWFGVLSLVAFSNHKRNHPSSEQRSDTNKNDSVDSNSNVTVTRELMMELGLPMQSKAVINLADFEYALEQSAQAKMNDALAHKVESIISSLNYKALDLDEAAALIRQAYGLIPPPEKNSQSDQPLKVGTTKQFVVDEWKGWTPWKK